MCILLFYLICLAISQTFSVKDSLQYISQHRKVYNFSITTLGKTENSTNKNWIEYTYYFKNRGSEIYTQENNKLVLTVGIFQTSDTYFDCNYMTENGTIVGSGYSFELLNIIQETANLSIKFVHFSISNDLLNHIEESLVNLEIDIMLSHHNFEYKSNFITSLHPTLKSSYVFVYKRKKVHETKDIFIITFVGWLWFCFLIFLILLAMVLRISTRVHNKIKPKDKPWSWVDITLWAIAATCQQGLSYEPSGVVSCTIFLLGYFLAYLIYTGFTAAITSILVQNDLNYQISEDDIKISTVVCLENFKHHFNSIKLKSKKVLFVSDLKSMFHQLNGDNVVGFVPKLFLEQYFARNFDYNMVQLYSTLVLSSPKYVTGFAIALNNTWSSYLNPKILLLHQTGVLKKVLNKNLLHVPLQHFTVGYSQAGLEHIGSALFLFLAGLIAALLFLLFEFTFAYYKHKKHILALPAK